MCVVQCSERRNVFGYDEERRKAVVIVPENCMVGCKLPDCLPLGCNNIPKHIRGKGTC
jgi:hypothetical protein